MLNPQVLADAVATAKHAMLTYDDARALHGVANPEWVQAHFTHRISNVDDRGALHGKIIADAFAHAVPAAEGAKPEAIVFCGPFAAGKDHVLAQMLAGKTYATPNMNALATQVRHVNAQAVHSDMDAIRKQIPEYSTAIAAQNPDASAIVRAEVSGLSVAITKTAKEQRYPFVMVESLAGPSAVQHIGELSKTHHVTVVGIAATPQDIHAQNDTRAQATGRHIPRAQIDESIRSFSAVFPKLKDAAPDVDVVLIDNAMHYEPTVMYHARAGQVETGSFNPDAFVAFTRLADYGRAKPAMVQTAHAGRS